MLSARALGFCVSQVKDASRTSGNSVIITLAVKLLERRWFQKKLKRKSWITEQEWLKILLVIKNYSWRHHFDSTEREPAFGMTRFHGIMIRSEDSTWICNQLSLSGTLVTVIKFTDL